MKIISSKQDILKRVKESNNLTSNADLARFLGISPATLSNWKMRDSIDYDLVFSKCECVNLDWLLTGRGNMMIVDDAGHLPVVKHYTNEKSSRRNSVPLFDLQHVDDLFALFTNHPAPIDEIKLPNLPKCDGAVYMRGDTMSPELHSGDIVLYKEVKSLRKKENIFFGQIYLLSFEVNNDEHIVIKYVHESDEEGYITLVSCNKRYPPMPIPFESIKAMAMIKASVHYHTIS